MPTWGDILIAAILLTLGGPTIVKALKAWWDAERQLAVRVTQQQKNDHDYYMWSKGGWS